MSIPVVGDAVALPLVEEIETGRYDLSGLAAINNGAAPLSPSTARADPHRAAAHPDHGRRRLLRDRAADELDVAQGRRGRGRAVHAAGRHRRALRRPDPAAGPGGDRAAGWPGATGCRWATSATPTRPRAPSRSSTACAGRCPATAPTCSTTASVLLLGRESVTINSGGEKIFAEEVERAMMSHRAVRDVVVAGRPSERWGAEVVAVVALRRRRRGLRRRARRRRGRARRALQAAEGGGAGARRTDGRRRARPTTRGPASRCTA